MRHCTIADHLAHRLEGTPLPCACPACAERVRLWEADCAVPEALPPEFWTAQAARIDQPIARTAPFRRWALAGAAALLVLGSGLGVVLTRTATPAKDDYEARYAAVEAALQRSPIGDLEACGVLLNETTEETTTTTTEEAL